MSRVLLPFEKSFIRWLEDRGMGWERIKVPLAALDATTRAYRFTPAVPARGIVITLHGAGNDALFGWLGLFKRLLAEGLEVFTFDLPGHGRRTRTRFSADDAVASVEAALEHCAAPRPRVPVHAIGVSLGGAVLLGALPRLQDRLTTAALLVAPLRINLSPRAILRELTPRNLRLVWREREHYGLTGLIPSFGPFKRRIYPLNLAHPVGGGPFGYVDALNRDIESLALHQAARDVSIPVLLVYGRRDRIVPPGQGETLARLIPTAELFTVSRGTHLSTPLEPEVTTRLMGWISSREGAGAR